MSLHPLALFFVLLTISACGPLPGSAQTEDKTSEPKIEEYLIDDARISESSGLARSHRDGDVLWTHNDSGGRAQTYAVDARGHYLGTLQLQPALNLDWEDMTSFVEDGVPRLLIADMGDNDAFRPFLTFYIVEEPDLSALPRPFEVRTTPLRQVQAMYPDGPRDAESIAVDANEGSIYILSKRDAVPKLYRLPLRPLAPLVVAEDQGEIVIPRAPAGAADPESINWVTSMDIDASARRLVALTLTRAYLYARAEGESWQQALQREPKPLELPAYPQMEAAAFSADGQFLFVTSEGQPAPLARIALPLL